MPTATLRDHLAPLHPEPLAALTGLHHLATATVDSDLLALCASAIDAALTDQTWQPPRLLTAREQAFVAFTEQFVSSVSTLSSDQVDRLRAFAAADEIYNFINALYVIDMTRRLDLVIGRVLP